jgi:hypothetical protein
MTWHDETTRVQRAARQRKASAMPSSTLAKPISMPNTIARPFRRRSRRSVSVSTAQGRIPIWRASVALGASQRETTGRLMTTADVRGTEAW